MLGQIGLPGGGFGLGYSAVNTVGNHIQRLPVAAMPQGKNDVKTFIPVARIADMLLHPGDEFDYDGGRYRSLERTDIAMSPMDNYFVSMQAAIAPVGDARDDYEIFRGIAAKMGAENAFTEGRSAEDWQRWLYDVTKQASAEQGHELPSYDAFRKDGWFKLPIHWQRQAARLRFFHKLLPVLIMTIARRIHAGLHRLNGLAALIVARGYIFLETSQPRDFIRSLIMAA